VHLAHIRHPVVGDPVYGGRLGIPKGASEMLRERLRAFRRQALHAVKLGLTHPKTGEALQWAASVPRDMHELMEALAQDAREHDS
jgi:23S rRNA pseudouridine1911/1915/1917 synthase